MPYYFGLNFTAASNKSFENNPLISLEIQKLDGGNKQIHLIIQLQEFQIQKMQ